MTGNVVVDAGPLVSLCDPGDRDFRSCADALRRLPRRIRLITTLPAVTEAMYLLSDVRDGVGSLFTLLESGSFTLDAPPPAMLSRVRALMARYADLPMDFADGTVVELAERLGCEAVFTLDERDFRVYRPHHVSHFRLLPSDLDLE